MDDRTRLLLEAAPLPLMLRMASPNALAFLVQSLVSMAEVYFIGQLGTVSLASIALVFPLLMLTQMMANGALGGGITSAIARALGQGDAGKAEALLWHALMIAASGALLFLLVYLVCGKMFLVFLGGQGEVLQGALIYTTILFSGGILLWLAGAMNAVFRGMGNMRFPAFLMIGSALIQVPLSAGLILGRFGLPELGIAGAAVSAIVSGFLLCSVLLPRLLFGKVSVRMRVNAFELNKMHFHDILKVAAPASLSPVFTVLTILSLTGIVGQFGSAALAGYGIGSRIEFLLVPLVFGIGASMTAMVGVNIGAGKIDRAENIGWQGGFTAAAITGFTGVLLAVFPEHWIGVFTDDPDTFAAGALYIGIVGPFYAFQGIGLVLYFASQGAGDVTWPIIATILRFVIAVGGSFVGTRFFGLGLDSVFVFAAVAMFAYGLLTAASLKLGAWRS